MRWSFFPLGAGIVLASSVLAACASDVSAPYAGSCGPGDYTCISNAAFQYRQQAERYGALADRYQKEADIQAAQLGDDAAEVQKQRRLAQLYWAESEQADALARQLRQELPHNIVH